MVITTTLLLIQTFGQITLIFVKIVLEKKLKTTMTRMLYTYLHTYITKLITYNNCLNIVYPSIRGLSTKLTDLLITIYDFTCNVIIFIEAWLTDNIFNAEILCDEYQKSWCSNCCSDGIELVAVVIKLRG